MKINAVSSRLVRTHTNIQKIQRSWVAGLSLGHERPSQLSRRSQYPDSRWSRLMSADVRKNSPGGKYIIRGTAKTLIFSPALTSILSPAPRKKERTAFAERCSNEWQDLGMQYYFRGTLSAALVSLCKILRDVPKSALVLLERQQIKIVDVNTPLLGAALSNIQGQGSDPVLGAVMMWTKRRLCGVLYRFQLRQIFGTALL